MSLHVYQPHQEMANLQYYRWCELWCPGLGSAISALEKVLSVDSQVESFWIQVKVWSKNSGYLEMINYKTPCSYLVSFFLVHPVRFYFREIKALHHPHPSCVLPSPQISSPNHWDRFMYALQGFICICTWHCIAAVTFKYTNSTQVYI